LGNSGIEGLKDKINQLNIDRIHSIPKFLNPFIKISDSGYLKAKCGSTTADKNVCAKVPEI
jgi:hypothetical protein